MLGGKSDSCFYDKLKIACFLKSAPDIFYVLRVKCRIFGTCYSVHVFMMYEVRLIVRVQYELENI